MAHDAPTPTGTMPSFDPFAEAQDTDHFEFFSSLAHDHALHAYHLPKVFGYQITKFEVLLAIAAALTLGSLLYLAARMRSGAPPRGVLQNLLESAVYFVRDAIARPAIGHGTDGDKYVPYLATTFLFILIANLLGMIPFLGSPTGSLAVTAALALVSFLVTHGSGVAEYGPAGYVKTFVPHIHMEGSLKPMGWALSLLMLFLELLTPFIRVMVLSVRLFANILAGHTALYVVLYFIRMVSHPEWVSFNQAPEWLYYPVAAFSIVLVTALSMLELLVAGLQAFIFTLLTAIFIGLAKHPAH